MNKYLIFFFLSFVVTDAFAVVPVEFSGGHSVALVCDYYHINFNEVISTDADEYRFDNSAVFINDFADWQNWNADVDFVANVSLHIKNLTIANNGEKLANVSNYDAVNVTVKDADNLYKVYFTAGGNDLFLQLVRETNYEKVFKDARGSFIENIKLNHPNDKMVLAMNNADTIQEVNSVMNLSYHFNPMILMNPIKTINQSELMDFLTSINDGAGANIDYIVSDKINNYGGRIYLSDKWEDFYFRLGINLNRFSYSDNFNDFDGFAYGADIQVRKYFDSLWVDGLAGIKRANFNADNIYTDGDVTDNPKGLSESVRLSAGYDYKDFDDFVVSPFVGLTYQNIGIMGFSEKGTNVLAGLNGRYGFTVDGIKYEYVASVASDDKADWNIGLKGGFLSGIDNVGANIGVDALHNEFGISYKLSAKAKVLF